MTAIKYLLFIGCLWIGTAVMAQPVSETAPLRPNQLKNFAKNAERVGDTYSAIDYYEQYLIARPEKHKITFKLGMLHLSIRDYPKALEYFEKAYEGDSGIKLALFYQGVALKSMARYDDARTVFDKFKKASRSMPDAKKYKKLLKIELAGIDLAKNLIDTPLNVNIAHLDTSINKAHVEFNPIPTGSNSMVYASLPSDSIMYFSEANDSLQRPVRKFFVATESDGVWKREAPLEGPFNNEAINTGNGAYSPDGKRFYFTRYEKNWKYEVIGTIYMSEKVNGEWQEPVALNAQINDPNFTSTQPTVGSESKRGYEVLYFVSNRPGGKGGLDIWYTYYDKRKKVWREPKNAGSKVNTVADEMTPFYDMDTRTLYFSSNGWPSIGGMDIHKTTGEMRKWLPPENVGYPINSSVDDLYYVVGENKERGFFVSNRKGSVALKHPTCCDDIYAFEYSDYIHIALDGFVVEVSDSIDDISGLNQDIELTARDELPLVEKAVVSLFLLDPESGEEIFIKSDTTDTAGNYFFNLEVGNRYKVMVNKSGYFSSYTSISTEQVIKADTLTQPLAINQYGLGPIVVKNIYYPFDKYYLTDEAKARIDTTIYQIMVENPTIIAEISSHTDSKGTDRYNENLSQKRAESVVKYLLSKGIPKERLVAKGYGESQPIAPNENEDGSDNPDGRQKNRRTEFKVIGELENYTEILYED